MKKLILSAIFSVSAFVVSAQPYNPDKINKKAVQLYNQAMERAQDGNLISAATLLMQCIDIDKKYADAYLSLAGIHGQLKNHNNCIKFYEAAFAIDSDYTAEYKLPYSINLAALGRFQDALDAINQLLARNPPEGSATYKAAMYRKRCYTFAVEYETSHPDRSYVFAPQNLGPNINSSESEYFPSLTIDGKELVFTRRLNHFNEDFFTAAKPIAPGAWPAPWRVM